jgi:hypothetical protein
MLLPDRSRGVVFDGASYNSPSLRSELEQLGDRLLSQTVTEVSCTARMPEASIAWWPSCGACLPSGFGTTAPYRIQDSRTYMYQI